MKKILFALAVVLTAATHVSAVGKLDLKEITRGDFRGESMAALQPLDDGESYAQISRDGKKVVRYSFRTGKELGTLFDASTARGPKVSRVEGYIMSPNGKRMLIQTDTKMIYRRSFTATYYIYNIANNTLESLSDGGPQQTPLWSPDGEQVAFVRDNNIFLVKLLYNNAESQVTKDGERNKVLNGVPDWVCEEEFSHNRAMVFTADSKQIVWVRYDESDVPERYLPLTPMDWKAGAAQASPAWGQPNGTYTYKYPKPGEQNARVSLHSFDIKSRQTRTLDLPLDHDGYIPRILMTSDPARVAVFTLNRHQDCLRVYMANPLTTVCQQVVEDKIDKYVKEETFQDAKITAQHMVLTSERSGFNSIYVYSLNGTLQRTVRQNVITAVYGLDEQTGDLYFAALSEDAMNQKVYVSHRNGKTDCLTPKDGFSTALFSKDFRSWLTTWSDLQTPPVTTLCGTGGKVVKTMIDNKALADKYATFDMGTKELFSFETGEGIRLNGWMVKPAGFDASRRYPVVMYQYGGPGNQQVKNAWGVGMNGQGAILEQLLAQQGYVVVCVDGRGTGGRGAAFEKAIYLRLGDLEAKDQVETALWLARQPYVDKDRIAIWGWSYGGFNTLMSMSEGRDVFCCGIAIAPPTNWRYYDSVYTERYMRTPQENASGYDDVCPIARAAKLHGKLLLCHGLADDNVQYENTAQYVSALVEADKDFRQLVYTNRNHSIYGGNTRNHLFRQCLNFFNENLKQ